MKQSIFVFLGLLIAAITVQCTQNTSASPEVKVSAVEKPDTAAMIKRGEYLVTIGGCNDCHSPKIMTEKGPELDPKRLLSGHIQGEVLPAISDKKMVAPGQWALFSPNMTAAVGPWGTSFAANLTPDDTGIGNWTYAQFEKALREGKSKGLEGTRPLLPPMPWFNYAKMEDGDMQAMFAYLKSIPPVQNAVPNPIPPGI